MSNGATISKRKWVIVGLLLVAVLVIGIAVSSRAPLYAVRVAHYDPNVRSAGVVVSNCTDSVITFAWWLVEQNGAGSGEALNPHEAIQLAVTLPDDEAGIYIEGTPQPERPLVMRRICRTLEAIGIDTSTTVSLSVSFTNRAGWIFP